MKPTNIASGDFKPSDPYYCGNPGGTKSMTSEPPCNWNINPPSIHYNWVKAGGSACSSNSDCTSPNICGMSDNVG